MVVTDIQKLFVTAGLSLTVILAVVGGFYHVAAEAGRSEVQAAWDKEKAAQAQQVIAAQSAVKAGEFRHRQETARIEDQLRKSEATHEAAIAALRSDYVVRLRTSTARAAVYWRMSTAGPAACDALADHASGLDRSLEQGRSLAEELRSALVLREDQLKALGAAMTNDRQLVGDVR